MRQSSRRARTPRRPRTSSPPDRRLDRAPQVLMPRERLDRWMVEHALADTREKAQALIMAGSVLVNGQKAQKPGQLLPENPRIELTERLRFVSRGGLKLEGALIHWQISPLGLVCGDFGSSTGGFTDCLLQQG